MIEGIYYSGTVVKVLKKGKNGFIRLLTGEEVFFNRDSFASREGYLEEGDLVTLQVTRAFDEIKGRMNMVAIMVERV